MKKLNLRDPIDEDLLINMIGASIWLPTFASTYFTVKTLKDVYNKGIAPDDKEGGNGGLIDLVVAGHRFDLVYDPFNLTKTPWNIFNIAKKQGVPVPWVKD